MEPLDFAQAWERIRGVDASLKTNQVALASALKGIERLEKKVGTLSIGILGQGLLPKLYDKYIGAIPGPIKEKSKEPSTVYAIPLPDDVLRIIFTKVPIRSLLQVRKVCRQWHNLCNEKEFKAYAYLLTRFPEMKEFPSDWRNAVVVTEKIKHLNDSIEITKKNVPKINRKQNILIIANCVTIAVSTYVLAPYIKTGFQKWGQYLEECERKAIEEIMNVYGVSYEEAKRIYLERLAEAMQNARNSWDYSYD